MVKTNLLKEITHPFYYVKKINGDWCLCITNHGYVHKMDCKENAIITASKMNSAIKRYYKLDSLFETKKFFIDN